MRRGAWTHLLCTSVSSRSRISVILRGWMFWCIRSRRHRLRPSRPEPRQTTTHTAVICAKHEQANTGSWRSSRGLRRGLRGDAPLYMEKGVGHSVSDRDKPQAVQPSPHPLQPPTNPETYTSRTVTPRPPRSQRVLLPPFLHLSPTFTVSRTSSWSSLFVFFVSPNG